jgi:hypothetical protein
LKTIVSGIVLIALTVATGLAHGRLTARWGATPDLAGAAARLQELPAEFGSWRLVKEEQLEPVVERELKVFGYLQRIYQHTETGGTVTFIVLLGPVGPISVHTPEICYSSRDYKVSNQRKPLAVPTAGGEQQQLWDLTFAPQRATLAPLRVVYGWTCDGIWQAAERPRFSFAGRPYLYKLQVAMTTPTSGDDDGHCEAFLRDFLPVLHPLLMK